jgi:hypothetical protein
LEVAEVVNIEGFFEKFDDTFSPKIVGELNGQYVMLVRCEGDKVPWHTHDDEDEMFLASFTLSTGARSTGLFPGGTLNSCCSSRRVSHTPEE